MYPKESITVLPLNPTLSGGRYSSEHHYRTNGVAPVDHRTYDTAWSQESTGGLRHGFSESSSYEAREHYERKTGKQKSQKTRGEREKLRRIANGGLDKTSALNVSL